MEESEGNTTVQMFLKVIVLTCVRYIIKLFTYRKIQRTKTQLAALRLQISNLQGGVSSEGVLLKGGLRQLLL